MNTKPEAFDKILAELGETLGPDSEEFITRLNSIKEICEFNPGMTRTLYEEIVICVSTELLRQHTTELIYDMYMFDKGDFLKKIY